MRRRAAPAIAALCALASVALAATSADGQSPEPTVTYQAPADCGSQAEFENRVRARTRSHTLAPAGDVQASRFEIRLRHEEQRVRGSITIYEVNGDANTRELEGATCGEAVDGLALIAALTLDPSATSEPEPSSEPTPPPAPTPTPKPSATTPPPPPTQAPPSAPVPPTTLDFSVSALAVSGVSQNINLAGEVGLGLTFRAIASTRAFLKAGLRYAPSQALDPQPAEGDVSFRWWAGVFVFCPALLEAGNVSVGLCLDGEFGQLIGTGTDTLNQREKTGVWVAGGPGLLLRWELISPVFIQLGAETLFPVIWDTFLLADAEVYATPFVAGRLQAGLGASF